MSKTTRVKRPDATLLGDQAYIRIKRDIVDCVLHPGSAVTEMQLTRRYNFGKAPVRSALVRLRQEGLVQPVPRRGYLISAITIKDIEDMFEFRLLLEPGTARLAAGRITAADIRQLKALCQADRMTRTSFNHANTEFHVAIARVAGNQRVTVTLQHLLEGMERLFHRELTREDHATGVEEHGVLLEALQSGDVVRAQEIATLHIEKARQRVIAAILDSDETEVEVKYPRTPASRFPAAVAGWGRRNGPRS